MTFLILETELLVHPHR